MAGRPGIAGASQLRSARPRLRGRPWLAVALLLVGSETLVCAWAHHLRVGYERYDYRAGVFRLVPGSHGLDSGATIRINQAGFRGDELAPAGPDLFRIVALGDSCTFGSEDGTRTYPALLEARLREEAPPGIRVEVVNAAISGADSRDALRRFASAVRPLEPDLVTIYVGWNDLMKASPLSQAGGSPAATLSRAIDQRWLVRGIRKALFFHLRPRLEAPETGPGSRSGRFTRFLPRPFESRLEELVDRVLASGAQPVLVTLATPLHLEMDAARVESRGIYFPYFARGNRVGDTLDLVAAYNRAIRRVAAERELVVIDLARAVGALPDATPFFWDTMHWNYPGQDLVAGLFQRALARGGLLPTEATSTATREAGAGPR